MSGARKANSRARTRVFRAEPGGNACRVAVMRRQHQAGRAGLVRRVRVTAGEQKLAENDVGVAAGAAE